MFFNPPGLINKYCVGMSKSDWVTAPKRVEKPWGYELWFALQEGRYCGKYLFLKAGESLSLQYHNEKDETQYCLQGRMSYEVGTDENNLETFEVVPGDVLHFVPGTRHRITAIEDSVFLEASTTELLDVVRLEDKYGRAGTNAP
jgi:mannose-6-phosphate isomerase